MAKRKSTASEVYAPLFKSLEKLHNDGGYSAIKWFELMIDDVLAQLGKRLDKPWDEHEHKRLFELSGLYGDLVIKSPFSDILGGIYQALSSEFGKKQLGQFFTPEPIARVMAQMQVDERHFEELPVVRMCEPTAGSGVMLLAFLKNVFEKNPDYAKKLSMTAIDIDLLCIKMATAQVLANNMIHGIGLGEFEAYHGDSLGDPQKLALFFGGQTQEFAERTKHVIDRQEDKGENKLRQKSGENKSKISSKKSPTQQGSLFDSED